MTKLKDIPKFDRPREKFLEKGPDALTDSELLAILLGSGIKGTNVKVLSQKILKKFGDNFLNASIDDLMQISGIGQAKALQISAALALTKRIFDKQNSLDNLILSAQDAIILVSDLKDKKQEHLICLYLNARNALLKKETISIGTLDKSIIHPREIFAPGLEMHAAGVILVHNHPSGDSSPSEQDKQVAKRIIEAGQLMGVNVIDFLIIAKNGVHSILGEIKNTELTNTEYVAEGSQATLFDLLVDTNQKHFYGEDVNVNVSSMDKKRYKVVSLFAGCGGLDLGFVGNFDFLGKRYGSNNFEIIWANDIDESSCVSYQKYFKHKIVCGDIVKILESKYVSSLDKALPKKADIVLGGFPCQDFSHAGKRKGFNSMRGLLYKSMAEVIKRTKPVLFVAENVEGLLTMNGGEAIQTIVKDFKKLGYHVVYKLLTAANYGVPQIRKRVIIVGTRKDKLPPFEHPKPILNENIWVNLKQAIGDLEKINEGKIANHYWSKAKKNKGQGNSVVSADKPGPTMRTEHHGNIEYHWNGKRRLSAREAARIQSFPDDYIFYPSTSSAYKQIGNAVPPVLAWHVATAIEKFLDKYLK
jgi:DNA (cytosine-5)-methyltransferase 1